MKNKRFTVKDLKKIVFNIKFILKVIKASSWTTAISIVICSVLSGIITPVYLYVWKYVIDSAAYSISSGVAKHTIIWLLVLSMINVFEFFFYRLSSFFEKFQVDYLDKYISNMVITKVDEIDIAYFEEAGIYDIVERVNRQSASRSLSILTMLILLVKNLTTFVGIVLVVGKFNLLIVFLCCIFTVPLFLVNVSISTKQYNIFVKRSQKLRFMEYIKKLYTEHENIKELKIYRAISLIIRIDIISIVIKLLDADF